MADTRNVCGMSHERLYKVYNGMISRCYNKKHPKYSHWGGRGIRVCEEWLHDYQSFRSWALRCGYDENGDRKLQTLDRIDNNGDYCPENCRWASQHEQNLNRRYLGRSRHGYKYNWTFEGVTKSVPEWCEIFNVSQPMVMYRVLKKGMDPFDALSEPVTRGPNVNNITSEQCYELRQRGMTIRQISDMLGCSKTTVRRRLGLEG